MANNTISQVEINGTTYDLLDANTLSALDSLKTRVTTLEDSVAIVKNNSATDDSYIWDIKTLNTTDTWIPVITDYTIQHRNADILNQLIIDFDNLHFGLESDNIWFSIGFPAGITFNNIVYDAFVIRFFFNASRGIGIDARKKQNQVWERLTTYV